MYKRLEAKLPPEVDKYIGPQMEKAMGMTLSQFRQKGNQIGLYLQPVTDIHLHSDLTGDMEPHGDMRYVYILSAVAVFMLLVACINFMNLSTAGASKRAKEVGIRKVLGSVKGQLVRQFLLESFLLTSAALLLALVFVNWALPFFNELAGQNLGLQWKSHLWILPCLLGFGLLTGFLAGSYPAFYLSSFNPVSVLKGRLFTGKGRGGGLRSGLVVFQFFISISLIAGTIVVYKQLSYIQHKKLGYDKDHVLILEETYWLGKNQDAFRRELLRDPRILNVSASDYIPAGPTNSSLFYAYPDDRSTSLVKTQLYNIDENYIPTLGMEMAAGRNFSPAFGSDSTGIIINETAAKDYGWGQNALGHTISHTMNDGKKLTYTVIGVVQDFHFQSLHERTKEIGIRKVLGASVIGIVSLLSRDFLRLVFLAFIIAAPVAWYVMNRWLADFAYRISIDAWVFALTGLLAVIVTIVTIGFRAVKAATANPAESLRTE